MSDTNTDERNRKAKDSTRWALEVQLRADTDELRAAIGKLRAWSDRAAVLCERVDQLAARLRDDNI